MPQRPDRYRPLPRPARAPDQRPTAAARGYGREWREQSKGHLHKHPLCVRCAANGLTVAATVVDHVTPHKGNRQLFWARSNWQSLCERCHNVKTATEDGAFGRPTKQQ